MEIKTLKELKKHLGERLFACSLCKEYLDRQEVIRNGLLVEDYWRNPSEVIGYSMAIDTPAPLSGFKRVSMYHIKRSNSYYTSYSMEKQSFRDTFYEPFKIFTTEKELDEYISNYMIKHSRYYVRESKSKLNWAKKTVKESEKELAKRIKFAQEHSLPY